MKSFRTTGACIPEKNYMVDISARLTQIREMVNRGEYFTINRARQYGKTTTLRLLRSFLAPEYDVISLDFQGISSAGFESEDAFVKAFCRMALRRQKQAEMPSTVAEMMQAAVDRSDRGMMLDELFAILNTWCEEKASPVVLLIDEIDSASNNQVFLDFLAQLRLQYLEREDDPSYKTFQSVILAGVTDVRNLRRKIRPDEAHKFNSPWNIAADFNVDMSFNALDIAGMLAEYEADHHSGMDVNAVAQAIEDYTSGYPFLVSRICQLLDADGSVPWNEHGVGEIVRRIVLEKNTLFDSLMGKVHDNDKLRDVLWRILFAGETVPYNPDDISVSDAEMYGLVRNQDGRVQVANRIFEIRLYNFFLNQEQMQTSLFSTEEGDRSQFIENGRLNMERILERYVVVFNDLYGELGESFSEAEGRLRFLLFIRPIINGTGNYYIETQTRDNRRMDLVIDYRGERFVIELKIWRGNAYNERGEQQLSAYLDDFHLSKGYMLSYNFNRNKEPGIKHIRLADKELVEAVV